MNEPIVLIDCLAQHFVASVQRINTHPACFRFSSLRGLFIYVCPLLAGTWSIIALNVLTDRCLGVIKEGREL
jgi:hypothetical protein